MAGFSQLVVAIEELFSTNEGEKQAAGWDFLVWKWLQQRSSCSWFFLVWAQAQPMVGLFLFFGLVLF
ncbi:hypothetical protein ACFX13_012288 [Malus domestica]